MEAGQTVLGQKGTCRNRADGKSPAGFGQMENGSKRLSPFDTTLCRSQSGGQSINFDFPTWLTPAKDGSKWENVETWFCIMMFWESHTKLANCVYVNCLHHWCKLRNEQKRVIWDVDVRDFDQIKWIQMKMATLRKCHKEPCQSQMTICGPWRKLDR